MGAPYLTFDTPILPNPECAKSIFAACTQGRYWGILLVPGFFAVSVLPDEFCSASGIPERTITLVLMIRLSRVGARKKPYYRVVVIEKDRARDGRSIEVVGTYNPRTNPATVDLKQDRVDYWASKGAQLSDRVQKLVTNAAKALPQTA